VDGAALFSFQRVGVARVTGQDEDVLEGEVEAAIRGDGLEPDAEQAPAARVRGRGRGARGDPVGVAIEPDDGLDEDARRARWATGNEDEFAHVGLPDEFSYILIVHE
jgi:hypothetical protein